MPRPIYITEVNEMIRMWDYDKNPGEDPAKISVGSTIACVWKHIGHNHSFHASPRSIRHGHGCTICAGKEILKGYNDLLSQHPEICKEWDYERNSLGPESYTKHSGKKVWWVCSTCGRHWQACINNRLKATGCPYCISSRQTSFPEQAVLYYVKKYYPSIIVQYRFSSKYTVDIYIPDIKTGIEYDGFAWHRSAISKDRENYKNNYFKEHGLKLLHIKETEKKSSLSVKGNSIFFFRDRNDANLCQAISLLLTHFLGVQDATPPVDVIVDRKRIIKNYRTCITKNSLLQMRPDLASEWDYNANLPLKPESISYKSNESVNWVCPYGHTYKMSIDKRTSRDYKCPYCSNRRLLVGTNDFQTWCKTNGRNDLLEEWNDVKSPEDCLMGNHSYTINWKCSICSTEWKATILSRAHGYKNCPNCEAEIKYRHIIQLSSRGTSIAEFPSVSSAAKKLGINRGVLVKHILKKRKINGSLFIVKPGKSISRC